MKPTYLCGHCPLGQEARSTDIDEIRNHITQATDSRHKGIHGAELDAVILRAGDEDDGTLSIALEDGDPSSDNPEKRAIAAYLQYPYTSDRMVRRIADVSETVTNRVLDDYPRVALERERRALDFVREDTRYRQQPDGTPKQPTIDDTERAILTYALDNPDDTAEDVKDALDLGMSAADIKEVVKTKTICPKLPTKPSQLRILRYYRDHPDASRETIAEATDTGIHQVKDTFLYYASDDDDHRTYLNLDRLDEMTLEDDLIEDASERGFPINPPDERPTMHVHKDTLLYLYHYRDHTLAAAGRICGVTGPTINSWLIRHDIHPAKSEYDFELADLYDGYDAENDRDYTHLIPSSRDADETPAKTVREAGNVRYEGTAIAGAEGVHDRDVQTFDERPVTPGQLPDDPSEDRLRNWLDADALHAYEYPDALHDTKQNISNNSSASRYAGGALAQLPPETEVQQPLLCAVIADMTELHEKTIEERIRALANAGHVSTIAQERQTAPKYVFVTAEQRATLRGEETEDEPSTPEPDSDVEARTPDFDVERADITPGSRAQDPPIREVTHDGPGGQGTPEGRPQEIIAGQHPDDILSPEDYKTLIRLVAQDEGHFTDRDRLLTKLIRLGGVALEGEETG